MKRPAILGLAIAAMTMSPSVWAQTWGISPVRVEMTGGVRAATVSVRNTSDTPINLQVRAMDWSQVDGKEGIAPTDKLIVSPPISSLAPGEEQLIRLLVDGLPPLSTEKAFRLVLDQLPSAAPTPGVGMRVQLRALVPVFVVPQGKVHPDLHWSAKRTGQGLALTVTNIGARHDKLADLKIAADGTRIDVPSTNSGYVLSGGTQQWIVPGISASAKSLKVSGKGEFGEVDVDVPIVP